MSYEDEQIRDRIKKLYHHEDMSMRQFALSIERPPSNFSKILSGERNIPKTLVQEILKQYPNVNKQWLLFGEGPMYEGGQDYSHPTDTKPRLPRTLTSGHLTDYFEGDKRHLCQEKPVIKQFPDYDFSLFLKTDRMSPNYRRGDELFFKKTDIKEWGSCFLLDTNEGPKFKKVYEDLDEKGKPVYRCVSFNKVEYPDFFIPREMVNGFYKCVGALRIL